MRLKFKRKLLTKKDIKNFHWHCGFCGRIVPLKRKNVMALYLKEKPKILVCEYWCPYEGIITRFEYKVGCLKEVRDFISKMNVYTDTLKNN